MTQPAAAMAKRMNMLIPPSRQLRRLQLLQWLAIPQGLLARDSGATSLILEEVSGLVRWSGR